VEVYDLAGAGVQQDSIRVSIGRLIELVGTAKFERELFRVAHETTRCQHLTAFAARTNASPRVLYAANVGPLPVARNVAQKYVDKYWALDPARRLDKPQSTGPRNTAMRIVSNDIYDGSYRQECYTSVKLLDRFTVLQQRNHETVCLNFYRGVRSGPFGGSEVDRIVGMADLLISLVMKQETSLPDRERDLTGTFVDRLRLLDPSLPPREAEVCGAIAGGMTSEAIALTLGISINTVLTYRKRAYLRLGISSQNELLRLVLN
jgi:DNA-binding CsgD family transcriptional regulator